MSGYHFSEYGVMIPMAENRVELPAVKAAIAYWNDRQERELAQPVYRYRAPRHTQERKEAADHLRLLRRLDRKKAQLVLAAHKAVEVEIMTMVMETGRWP